MSIRYSKYLSSIVFLSDLFLLNISIAISQCFSFYTHLSERLPINFIFLINISWVVVSIASKNFQVIRPLILKDNVNRFLLTLIYHLLLVFGIIYFFKIYNISRFEVVTSYCLFCLCVITHRSILFFILDYIRKKGYNHRQIIIIGNETIASRLIGSFSHHPEYGYDLNDFISEEHISNLSEDVLISRLLSKNTDEIFVCYKEINKDFLKRLIRFGDDNSIKIKVVSDLTLSNNHVQLVNYDTVPVLHITPQQELPLKIKVLKRGFDIIFSTIVMTAGLPIFVVIYFITKSTSKGPAFFRQERVGRNGKLFYIYKFRSMYIDAEKYGPQLSKTDDPRITKWGRIIRRTRLDELPQFWNVIKGEMSVVGPRPERQHFIEKIIEKTPNYRKLLGVKPGITSIGQVHYGYAENVEQMCDRMRYDLIYLQNVNLNSDINIILKTVRVMIQGKGK